MQRTSIQKLLLGTVAACLLCGCGTEFPELTDEEYEKVVEYSAGLLLKHAEGGEERLQNVAAIQVSLEQEAKKAEREARKNGSDAASTQEAENTQGVEAEEASEQLPVESDNAAEGADVTEGETSADTDYDDAGEEAGESTGDETETKTVSIQDATEDIRDIFGDLTLEYEGYAVKKDYPNSSVQGAVSAAEGYRILVLNFTVSNKTSSDIKLDMAPHRNHIRILVNDKIVGYPMLTMLDDDLGTYSGTISAGESREMVFLVEVTEDRLKQIQTIDLLIGAGESAVFISLE